MKGQTRMERLQDSESARLQDSEMGTGTETGEWLKLPEPETAEEAWERGRRVPDSVNSAAGVFDNSSEKMKRALLDSPFELFPDESLPELARMMDESPEMKKSAANLAMKYTAARWFANHYGLDYQTAADGFESISKRFFGDEAQTDPRTVYMKLRELRQKEEAPGPGERLGRAFAAGMLDTGKGAVDTLNVVGARPLSILENLRQEYVFRPIARIAGMERQFEKAEEFRKNYFSSESLSRGLSQLSDNYRREIKYQESAAGESSGFFEDVGAGVIRNLPTLLLSLATAEAKIGTIAFASGYFGVSGMSSELEDTAGDPHMSDWGRLANAVIVGTAEAAFEEWHGVGKILRKYWTARLPKEEVKRISESLGASAWRVLKSLGADAAGEGFEEVETGIVQRFSNLLFHKDGKDLAAMSLDGIAREVLEPVPLEFAVGGVSGGMLGGLGLRYRIAAEQSEARRQNFRADLIGEGRRELEQLRAKENPTEQDVRKMEKLESALAENNTDAILDFALNEAEEEKAEQEHQRELDELPEDEWAERMAAEALAEEKKAQQTRQGAVEDRFSILSRILDDTLKDFHNIDCQLIERIQDIQDEGLRAQAEREPRAEGFFNPADGRIYLIAENLEAGRVRKVLLHEAVGHKGLRELFGAKYDAFLDRIADDHAEDVSKVAGRRGFDLSDPAQRLEAVDEFLAELAENKEEKQGLYGKIKALFREWLRSIPAFRNLRYTDEELDHLIDMAFRKARLRDRERARLRSGEIARGRDVRFAADAENGRAFPLRMEHTYPEVHEILRRMQGRELHNQEENLSARISSTGVNKVLSNKARQKSIANGFSDEQHLLAAANLDRLFENGVLLETRPDKNNDPNIASIKRLAAPFYVDGDFAEAILTLKESVEHGNRVYSLELDEIRKPSSSDKRGLENQADTRTLDGYEKITRKIEKARAFIEKQGGKDRESARSRDVRFAVNEKFNEELEKQRNGTLEAGHIYQLGMPPQVLLDTGVPDLPIELSAARLAEKAGTAHHPFGIEEVRSLPLALEHPIGVFAYGNKEKAQNIVVELQKDGKHFIVGLSLKFEHDGLIVNSIRGLYPKDTHEWLNWIQQGKALYLDKEKIQSMIAQQRRNPADVSYLDLDSLEKIVQDFRNVKGGKDKKEERISNREQGSKKEKDGKGGVRFSVAPVWTGSAADYDQPSLQYIGTGEGAQVYGWGLYGSESEQVARWYAKADVKRKNSAKILLDGKEYDLHEIAGVEGDIAADVLEDVLDRKGSTSGTMTFYRSWINKSSGEEEEIYRRRLEWLEKNKDRIQYVPEKEESGRRHLYRQTFFAGREENLLDWDKPVTEEQRKKIAMQLKMEELYLYGDPDEASAEFRELKRRQNAGEDISGEELDAAYDKASKLHAQRNVIGKTLNGDVPSGSMVYENLEEILGEPQAVSEFLYRAGIDGVTYIGNSSNVRNYVAFSDQDIRVDEHIRFSVAPDANEQVNRWAKILLPEMRGRYMLDEDAAAAILANKGIRVDPVRDEEILMRAGQRALLLLKDRNDAMRKKGEENHLRKRDPFYRALSDAYGSDFKINAGAKHDGKKFTGTWMDQRKKEENRKGVSAEDAAKVISKAVGKEITADHVVEHFGKLKRATLLKDYRDRKRAMRELKEIEYEIEEEERMKATGTEFGAQEPFHESPEQEKIRKKYQREEAQAEKTRRAKWLIDNLPVWRWVMGEVKDDQFKIRPSDRFRGEAFTGSFIVDEFRKYSEKKNRHPEGSKKYQQYLLEREEALNRASGYHSDELARQIARKTGREELEVEQELIDFFRDLKRGDLIQMYRDARREELNREREEKREGDRVLGSEFAARHFKALLDAANNDRINIIQLQAQAASYAKRYLPKEMQGEFLRGIADLSKWESTGSVAYPEGRRQHEMKKLLGRMQTYRIAERIRELANGTKVRVTKSGHPISPLGENRERVDQIRKILSMQSFDVENMLLELREQQQTAIEKGEQAEADRIGEQMTLYDTFGRLDEKSPEECLTALRTLRGLIDNDKENLLNKLRMKREENGVLRHQAVVEITGNKDGIPVTGKPDHEPRLHWKFWNKFWLDQYNLRNLFALATSRSDKDFDTTVFGGLYRKLEAATQKGATLDRECQTRSQAKIEEIFGLDSLAKKAAFWRSIEKQEEHTGVFVNRYSREIQYAEDLYGTEERRGFNPKSTITVSNLRKLLKEIESGTAKGEWDEMTVSFLRQQLADFDLGIEREYNLFGNDDENGAWKLLIKRNQKTNEALENETELLVIKPAPGEKKRRVELSISKAEGANILMAWEQKDVQMKMRWNGWTDESIAQLKEFIGRDMIEFAYWARGQIKEQSKLLDETAKQIYGAGLPQIENYFPTSYKESLNRQIKNGKADAVTGDSYGQLSVNPSFLIARRFHLSDIDIHKSIFQSFFRHQLETNHFLAFGQTIRDCRSILHSAQVANAVRGNFGTEVYNQIIDRINVIANAGRDTGRAGEVLGRLFRYWVPSKIAVNMSSVAKQFAGVTSYMNDVPMKDFLKNFSETFTGSEDFQRFAEFAKESDYFKNRMEGGLNRDLLYLMKSARSAKVEDVYGNYLIDKGTGLTRWSDGVAALRGGYAVFKYHYEQAVKRGMSHDAAWDHAAQKWARATDETQQSGYLKDQNYYQSQSGLYRYFTAFLSNPVQIMNLELMTLDAIRFGSGKRAQEAKRKLVKQLFVNHILLPTLMTALTEFFRHGFDWDEYEWEDFLTAWLLGPFEGAFIAGKVAATIGGTVGDWIVGRKGSFLNSGISALPILDDSLLGLKRLQQLFKEDGLTGEKIYGSIQGLSDLIMSAGTVLPIPYAGAGAGITSAILRELKRWYRLLFEQQER